MVKVVSKIVKILEVIAQHREMNFSELMYATGLRRSNLSHLLKSLCDNGLLSHHGHGRYGAGEKLSMLFVPSDKKMTLYQIVNRCVNSVMHELNELAVVSMRHKGQRLTLAKAYPLLKSHRVNSSGERYASVNWYNTASGRILLAFQNDAEIKQIVDIFGLPSKDEWSEAATFEKMMNVIKRIREDRKVIMDVDEHVSAIAIPIPDASGENSLCVSMAFLKACCKLTAQEIVCRLQHYAEIMRREINFSHIVTTELEL